MKRLASILSVVLLTLSGFAVAAAEDFHVIPVKKKNYAPVEKTGQLNCHDFEGTPVDCAGTGQDGDIRAGVAWPTPRFADNGDGTVTANLTALIWLKNANCFPMRTWATALTDCNTLNSGECGLTDGSAEGDWRLPNVKEYVSLIDYGSWSPALPNTAGTGKWSEGDPFTNVQSSYYWSSATRGGTATVAFYVLLNGGYILAHDKTDYSYHVWPVRGGN